MVVTRLAKVAEDIHGDNETIRQASILDDDRRTPTMTLAGWRRFVDAEPAIMELLPDKAWNELSPLERLSYNEARFNYHSEMIVVATSTIRDVAKQGRLLTLLNRREISARRGLIVSGPQTTGKAPRSSSWAARMN